MRIGDRVRLSAFGRDYGVWPVVSDGTIAAPAPSPRYDWLVQWDDDREGNTIAHYENELEVIA